MKTTTLQSIKFSRLKRHLALSHWQVVGVLESLWLFTMVNVPTGEIGRFSNEDIAAGIEWSGDADQLIDKLIQSGWLHPSEEHRLVIGDRERILVD